MNNPCRHRPFEQLGQCGYCQSDQIMQAAALLARNSDPTKQEVTERMQGILCRCTTSLVSNVPSCARLLKFGGSDNDHG
jgi:aerobic-type carbon monoxide dehydrogenase small subunit (CoxS/CutS family)